jgi:hypothetical protein
MNNKYKYIGYLLMLLFLTSACKEEFLEIPPQDAITSENFYTNEANIRANTASLYGRVWFTWANRFQWCMGDIMPGDLYDTYSDQNNFFRTNVNETNSVVSDGWIGLFRVVSYANSIINDLPVAAKGVSQDVINRALGEGYFFRAAAYFQIAEYWEEAPIVKNSTEMVTSGGMMVKKNPQADLYRFIREDLEFAEANLPSSDDPGRVTKWSAKALLSKLYLTMAQRLTDPQSDTYFSKAKQYADDVIINSGHSLMANYEDVFEIESNNNSESLFAIQWMDNGWSFGNPHQAYWARSAIITRNAQAWGDGKCVTISYQNDVTEGDKRRKFIYMRKDDLYPKINKAQGGYKYFLARDEDKDLGNPAESATPTLTSLKKFVTGSLADNPKVGTNQDVALNQPLIRLADVYYTYVEAAIGKNESTTDAKAIQYFNEVYKRSGLTLKQSGESISFNELYKERRIEFGLEGIRWFDIKRYYYRNPAACLQNLNDQNRATRYTLKSGGDKNTITDYELKQDDPVNVSAEDMRLPIPATELVTNPLLEETEPYNFE